MPVLTDICRTEGGIWQDGKVPARRGGRERTGDTRNKEKRYLKTSSGCVPLETRLPTEANRQATSYQRDLVVAFL